MTGSKLIPTIFENPKGPTAVTAPVVVSKFRVTTLADITTANGRQVTSAAWDGRRDLIRQPTLDWPVQGNLTAADWTQWRTALSTTSSLRGRSLSRPLGEWTDDAEDVAWPWFYDPAVERLYHRDEHNHWTYLTRAPICTGQSAQAKFHNRFLTDTPPANRHRSTVEQHGSYTCLTGFAQEETTRQLRKAGSLCRNLSRSGIRMHGGQSRTSSPPTTEKR